MRKIKTVQIGIGHDHAPAATGSLRSQSDIFDFVGYSLPPAEKTRFPANFKALEGLPELNIEEVLADDSIEAVVIETEEVNLTDYALMAAKAGKHIHMDKPGGLDPDSFTELVRIMKSKGLVFHTGYMYRYNPEVIRAMRMIKDGALGEIFSIEAKMDCRHNPEKRQWLGTFPGGMMFFLGCHLVDLIYSILGVPEEIIPLHTSTGIDGVTAEDLGFTVFKYKNAFAYAKTCAEEMGGFERRSLIVSGSKGTIELCPLEMYERAQNGDSMFVGRTLYRGEAWFGTGTYEKTTYKNRYDDMFSSFAAMVRGEKENPWSYEYELSLYRIVLAACGVSIDYKKKILL